MSSLIEFYAIFFTLSGGRGCFNNTQNTPLGPAYEDVLSLTRKCGKIATHCNSRPPDDASVVIRLNYADTNCSSIDDPLLFYSVFTALYITLLCDLDF